MVNRILLLLIALPTACAPPWQGSPIEPTPTWLAEVDDLVADWRVDPSLPSIDTPLTVLTITGLTYVPGGGTSYVITEENAVVELLWLPGGVQVKP